MAIRYLSGINVDSNTLVVDSTNNRVGINTASPDYALDLGTSGTGNQIRARRIYANGTGTDSGYTLDSTLIFQGASNSFNITNPGSYPSVAFTINSSGNVGIGTTSPTRLLEISATNPQFSIKSTSATGFSELYFGDNTADNGWIGYAHNGDYMYFGTNGSERMRITSDGTLQVGTTSQTYNNATYGYVASFKGAVTTQAYISVALSNQASTSEGMLFGLSSSTGDIYVLDNKPLVFYTNGNEKMRIAAGGNVGIGTTSPSVALHTNGFIRSANSGNTVYTEVQNDGLYATGTDLYLLAPSTKFISFYAGGAERMRISSAGALKLNAYGSGSNTGTATQRLAVDASGNVIEIPIGSGPVDGNGTANYVTKWSDADTITNSIIYDNGTNVGIGSTIPAQKLQVNGAIEAGSSSVAGGPMIYQSYASPNYIGSIGSEYSSGAVLIGYGATGKSGASGYVSTFENFPGVRGLLRLSSGTFSVLSSTTAVNTAIGGDLTMTTTFTVTDAGNVGIGTTSPGSKLQVEGTNPFIRVNNTSANDHGIKISYNGSDAHGLHLLYNANSAVSYIDNTYQAVSGQVYGDIYVRQNVGGTMTPRITIKADGGNVGIGTTTPASIGTGITTLDIQGSSAGGVAFGPSGVKNYIYGASTMYVEAHTTAVFTTSGSEKMRLTTGGQLIVGGTTVGYSGTKLQVGNTSDAQNGLNILTSTTGYGYILFGDGAGADTYVGQIWYYHGDNYMGFQTNGGERMRITSAGDVGIGTTSPGAKLHVSGSSIIATATTIDPDSYANTVIAGNIADGSGWAALGIGGNAGTGDSWAIAHNGSGLYFGIQNGSAANTMASYMEVSPSRQITLPSLATAGFLKTNASGTLSVDTTAYVNGTGTANYVTKWSDTDTITNSQIFDNGTSVGVGTTSPTEFFHIRSTGFATPLYIEHTAATSAYLGIANSGGRAYIYSSSNDLVFGTTASVTERMRITSAGNVGIGTTNPTTALVIQGGGAFSAAVTIQHTAASGYSGIDFFENTGTLVGSLWHANSSGVASNQNAMTLSARNAGDKVYIVAGGYDPTTSGGITVSAGNVGIGTTSPATALDVSGDARFGGGATKLSVYSDSTYSGIFNGASLVSNESIYMGDSKIFIITAGTEKVRITSTGNVGIGTTSPGYNLTVSGTINVSDLYTLSASADYAARYRTYAPGDGNWGLLTYASDPEYHMVITGASASSGASRQFRVYDRPAAVSRFVVNFDGSGVGVGTAGPTQQLHVAGNVRVTGAYYDSNNEAGTSGQVLSSTGSGTDWVTPATTTASSLYDLLPAARTTYDWTVQMTSGTWADIFSSNTVLSNGTWMVQVYVSDFASGGQQYQETYSGVMSWGNANSTNQGGASAISEVVLHRSGHAANAGQFYLRTQERASSTLLLQGMVNYSHTSNTTINFKFVKVF